TDSVVTAELFYKEAPAAGCTDGDMTGWQSIVSGQAEGVNATYDWTAALPAGDYYVCAVTQDESATPVRAKSSSYLRINASPAFGFDEPAGADDQIALAQAFTIQYDLADADDAATVDLKVADATGSDCDDTSWIGLSAIAGATSLAEG